MNIKVQIDARQDGRYTATIKLIGWDLNRFRALISNLSLMPYGRQISQALGKKLVGVLEAQQAEAAQLAAEEPSEADEALERAEELELEAEALAQAAGAEDA